MKTVLYPFTISSSKAEELYCKICGGKSPLKGGAYKRNFYECSQCKFIFTNDFEIAALQKGMGMEGSWSGPGGGGYREYYLSTLLQKELGLKEILLFGTGNTDTFRKLKNEGYDVRGCDITPELIKIRKEEFGDDSFFSPVTFPKNSKFDIIVCVEVFEHFFDPKSSFDLLVSVLSDKGVICGTTNFYPGGSIVDSNNPGYMSHKGHVAYWSSISLGNLAKKFGLELLSFEMVRPGSVLPDEKFGQLWPNKRVFFIYKNIHGNFFHNLYKTTPILPIDKP